MKTSTGIAVAVALVVVGGGYWYMTHGASAPSSALNTPGPSGSLGVSGSPNQGNLGQPDNGTPQGGDTGKRSATVIEATSNASLGSIISSPVTGMTLYTYSQDTAGVSNCSGTCAANWPPYRVEPGITLLGAAGLNGTVASIARADGGIQLTYNGAPLYTYIKDKKPGDTTGQNVGGVWFVAKP